MQQFERTQAPAGPDSNSNNTSGVADHPGDKSLQELVDAFETLVKSTNARHTVGGSAPLRPRQVPGDSSFEESEGGDYHPETSGFSDRKYYSPARGQSPFGAHRASPRRQQQQHRGSSGAQQGSRHHSSGRLARGQQELVERMHRPPAPRARGHVDANELLTGVSPDGRNPDDSTATNLQDLAESRGSTLRVKDNSAIYQRNRAWHRRREEKRSEIYHTIRQQENDNCTFKPNVGRGPVSSASPDSTRSSPPNALHSTMSARTRAASASRQLPFEDRFKRLHSDHQQKQEELRMERERKELQECVFQPQTNSQLNKSVQSRFNDTTQSFINKMHDTELPLDQECTFVPSTNYTAYFDTTQNPYLSINVHERLHHFSHMSQALSPRDVNEGSVQGKSDSKHTMNRARAKKLLQRKLLYQSRGGNQLSKAVQQELGALRQLLTATYAGPLMGRSPDDEGEVEYVDSENEEEEEEAELPGGDGAGQRPNDGALEYKTTHSVVDFSSFLERQNKREVTRRRNLADLHNQTSFSHQPAMAAGSRRLVAEGATARRRGLSTSAMQFDADLTFFPKTTSATSEFARNVRRRSVSEMHADASRRERNLEKKRLAKEISNSKENSFAPAITPHAVSKARSHLSQDNLCQLTRHLAITEKNRKEKAARVARDKMEKEMAQCTHKPQTTQVPRYITSMAKSFSIVRKEFE